MSLRKAPLVVTFSGGLSTKPDAKAVAPTQLLDLQNAQFFKETTLAKRNGYRALGNTVDGLGKVYEQPVGLGVRDDELLLFTGKRCYSYRDSVDRWADAGEVASVVANDVPVARTGTDQTMPDHASNGGVTVVAWEDNRGGVWGAVLEQTSARVLVAPVQLDAAGISPRCYAAGAVVHLLWAVPNLSQLVCLVVNPVAPGFGVPQVLTEDLWGAAPVYDACAATYTGTGDPDPGLIAWATADGHRMGYVAPSGQLGSPLTGYPSAGTFVGVGDAALSCIACTSDPASGIGITWATSSGDIYAALFAGSSFVAPTQRTIVINEGALARAACTFASGTLWLALEQPFVGRADLSVVFQTSLSSTGVVGAVRSLRGHGLVSRAFTDGTDAYVGVVHPVQFYPYVAIVRLSAASFGGAGGTVTVARLQPGEATGLPTRKHLTSVQLGGTAREHLVALGYRIQLSSANSDQWSEQGIRLVTLDFDHAEAYQSAQLGRSLYLAGAVPQSYDGRGWAESDFHAAPDTVEGNELLAPGIDGFLTVSSTYGYKLLYEFVDAQGELHRGAVGDELNIALDGAHNAVTVTVPTYRLTARTGHVRVSVWRSPANQTGLPTDIPFFRVTSTDPNATGPNGYLTNDPTVDTLTFIDQLSDADLGDREPLYTNGGIFSNDPPPIAGGTIVGGKTRLFFTDPDDGHVVRYSQQLDDDTAAEMSDALSLRVDPYGGAIAALGVMDDGVFAFKESAIYVFVGPGPDADGDLSSTTNAFSPPALVTSDVGCGAPGSVCQSPVGIVFQSAKGIMLLGRDRQVQRIGDPVFAYNAQTIVRATLLPDRTQIVFLTDAGRTLMWDYERQQWSTYTNHEGIDAALVGGSYYYLRTDGRVFVETPGVYKDDNAHVPMRIDTAWIKAAGYLQGWQKILTASLLGAYKSPHTLSVRYRINYQEAWSPPFLLDVDADYDPSLYGAGAYGAGPYGGPGGPSTVYQKTIHLNRRCQSIAFRIEDVEGAHVAGQVPATCVVPLFRSGTVLAAKTLVGTAGQVLTVQAFADRTDGTVAIVESGTAIAIHYTPNPAIPDPPHHSTSLDIETAITVYSTLAAVYTPDPLPTQTFAGDAVQGSAPFTGGDNGKLAPYFGAAFELSELLLVGGVIGTRFPVGAARQN